jgi:ribosome-associated toxin RatA of RatAB toxin-antitoxin module
VAVALLVGLASLPPADAADVRVAAQREGGAVLVEAQAELRAPLDIAWAVVTDYEGYARFVPDLQSSRVLSRDGNRVLVEQRGTAGFFLFRYPLELRFEASEEPLERVSSHLVAGNFKEMSGVYQLAPAEQSIHFSYRGRLVPAFSLPPLIGLPAVRASVERQFGALVREIERRNAQREPAAR